MADKITKVEVWFGEIDDQPGGLAQVLDALASAGATVECCIARRKPDQPGRGVVFVSPIKGKKALEAARSAGLAPATNIGTLRVEGADRKGAGASMTRAIGDANINLRGVSAAVIGKKFVCYFGFDSAADADRAAKAIKSAGKKRR
jgi:hypothetical protein